MWTTGVQGFDPSPYSYTIWFDWDCIHHLGISINHRAQRGSTNGRLGQPQIIQVMEHHSMDIYRYLQWKTISISMIQPLKLCNIYGYMMLYAYIYISYIHNYPYTNSSWWFGTLGLFSISYMGCHPSHWRTYIYFSIWLNHVKTTNQIKYHLVI